MSEPNSRRIPPSRRLAESLTRAAEIAQAGRNRHVTLEHFLQALIEDLETAPLLSSAGIDVARLDTDLTLHLSQLPDPLLPGEEQKPIWHPELLRMIDYSSIAAAQSQRPEVTSAIVLAALIGDGRSTAARLLQDQGLSFDAAIDVLRKSGRPAERNKNAIEDGPPAAPIGDDGVGDRSRPDLPPGAASRDRQERMAAREARLAAAVERRAEAQARRALPEAKRAVAASPFPTRATASTTGPVTADHPMKATGTSTVASAAAAPGAGPGAAPASSRAEAYGSRQTPLPTRVLQQADPSRAAPPAVRHAAAAHDDHPTPGAVGRHQDWQPPEHDAWPDQYGEDSHDRLRQHQDWERQPAAYVEEPGNWAQYADDRARHHEADYRDARHGNAYRATPDEFTHAPYAGDVASHPTYSQSPHPLELQDDRHRFGQPAPFETRQNPGGHDRFDHAMPDEPALPPSVATAEIAASIPRRMSIGTPTRVEVRIDRRRLAGTDDGALMKGGTTWRGRFISKAIVVRLKSVDQGFWVENGSPETQWIEGARTDLGPAEFASWRWTVTPRHRGRSKLVLAVSARTVGHDGLTAETALPDRAIEVRVRSSFARLMAATLRWLLPFAVGAGLAVLAYRHLAWLLEIARRWSP